MVNPSIVEPRPCGPCDLCCKVMAVDEIAKPAGAACHHLNPRGGCGIYATKPASCSGFYCEWTRDAALPQRFRPNLSKVVLTRDAPGRRFLARCHPKDPLAWRAPYALKQLMKLCRANWGQGIAVFAVSGPHYWLLTPNGVRDLGEISERTPIYFELGADGDARVEILPDAPAGEDAEAYAQALRERLL